MAKRFNVTSITRDKEYNITRGTPDSKLQYFSVNPNGEAEVLNIYLHSAAKARNKLFDYDFADLTIKGRSSQGNMVTKHPIRKVDLKSKGVSTIGGRDIWYEPGIGRLNIHDRGEYLGNFQTDDLILVIFETGDYEITNHELTNRYASKEIKIIEKYDPKKAISVLHYDGNGKNYCVKRFNIETASTDKKFCFITEGWGSKMVLAATHDTPIIELTTKSKTGDKKVEKVNLAEFIDVKGWKSIGNKLCGKEFVKAKLLPPPPPEKEEEPEDIEPPVDEDNGPIADIDITEDTKPAEDAPTQTKNEVKSEVTSEDSPGEVTPTRKPIAKKVIAKKENEPEEELEENNEVLPKLLSKEKDKDSFTSGDQISLL
jgi:topoisomerase-4 subunit A